MSAPNPAGETPAPVATNPSWERVQLARHPKRPHALDYVQRLLTSFEELHGDRTFADDHSIVGVTPAIAATATVPFVPNAGDQLNLLPGRSVMVTFTAGWAPRR